MIINKQLTQQQIKKIYPNCEYTDDCEWVINDQLKFLLLSHGFIFNDSINNNNMNKQLTQQNLDELMKQTLLNILSAKGIIYTYYKNNKLTKGNYEKEKR